MRKSDLLANERLNNEIQSLSFVYLPDTQLEAAAVHYTAGRRPTCCIRHLVQEAEVLHTDCEAVDTDVVAAVVAEDTWPEAVVVEAVADHCRSCRLAWVAY